MGEALQIVSGASEVLPCLEECSLRVLRRDSPGGKRKDHCHSFAASDIQRAVFRCQFSACRNLDSEQDHEDTLSCAAYLKTCSTLCLKRAGPQQECPVTASASLAQDSVEKVALSEALVHSLLRVRRPSLAEASV
jgi:hypothetical protein